MCDKLTASLSKLNIGTCYTQPVSKVFKYNESNIDYSVTIEFINFNIEMTISSSTPVITTVMSDNFLFTYELLMLFLGYFPTLKNINIVSDCNSNNKELEKVSQDLIHNLLGCYSSYSDITRNCTCLIDISTFNYEQIISSWISFRKKYQFQHGAYLYTTSSMEFLVDLRLALLSQVFEPLFKAFCNRDKPKHFKDIIQEVILINGTDIFKKEINEKVLVEMIDKIKLNRNQLFHVENKSNTPSGAECLYFFHKLNLLYRYCIFSFLRIDFTLFSSRFNKLITAIEKIP